MKKLCALVVAFIVLTLAACSSSNRDESLVGIYGVQKNGKMVPVIKVDKTDAGYAFSDNKDGQWRVGTETAQPMTKENFEKLMGEKIDGAFIGIKTKGTLVAKVPEGFSKGKFKTSTGYMMVFLFGPVELTKLSDS